MGELMEPRVQEIMIADSVSKDAATGQHTISGLRRGVVVQSLPSFISRIHCYIAVEDIRGEASGEFQFLDPELAPIVSLGCGGPLLPGMEDIVVFTAYFHNIPVKSAGAHAVQFLLNGKVLAVTRLDVILPVPSED